MIYKFDVALSSHDLLREGKCEPYWTHVILDAESDYDAHLLAAQLAHTVYGHLLVTRVLWKL